MAVGHLLAEQVKRANAARQKNPVVTLVAEFPGDGSQVNLDWWLRELNRTTQPIGIRLDFADADHPAQIVDNHVSPTRLAQLERRLEEAKAYINDLEENMQSKIDDAVSAALGKQADGLSSEEAAIRAVDSQGFYVDERGTWVNIADEAKRIGKNYITVWRAAKQLTPNFVDTWIVGNTNANGERILVRQGSFVKQSKRSKR